MRHPQEENSLARRVLTVLTLAALAAMVIVLGWKGTDHHVEVVTSNDTIRVSPTEIKSMLDIGQWELLTVDLEEVADTTATRTFGSDMQLSRIYYGRMRLGIDLRKAPADWLTVHGDSVEAKLPPVTLLDEDFIDEAKTTSFFEIGSWDQASRDALYRQARRKMMQRGYTPANIDLARQNAIDQFTKLFQAMGMTHVDVHF